ncbi:bifunctional DNA-formamidopyrimidine glycosylase/DNA-(apurinic or apyrimidinic site) lyase [Leucothrix pacifica]|uniref:Formamidopyrimidine-DNA glycosylase n=1 Tax=Leucothrix pacifica TaxID=1247513 RepID=A0A317CVA9_9GAMM|nr:bifunctional DNA-formamidopyrimidine glycosylase/DNA-(apurinic or apyrimidinic site) lyase [Leucothrix pacifica]PWR00451.1 DNA-formamidopyrimidine glycosylase [Leucothrix pacifica]
MPELPEVETTCRGIAPHTEGQVVRDVVVRQAQLRWPVPDDLQDLVGQTVNTVSRRAKYVLLEADTGTVMLHLGMSGSLRIVEAGLAPEKHDHVDLVLASGKSIRLHDPRRFGAVLWTQQPIAQHKLIQHLGPEPLTDAFNAEYLHASAQKRSVAVKQFIMDAQVVVGVGNIYASESLFMAGISPKRAANKVSKARYVQLTESIKQVLARAIAQGGTTLRDFVQAEGKPGYFQQQLNVYGRTNEPCRLCAAPIKQIKQGQRSTFYCSNCQK